MALEVQFEKRLASYNLNVEFSCDAAPLAVLGPSGAGKSMTLRCIAGLERPDRGHIALDGRVLFDSSRGINVPSRDRRIGLLFQHYALFPHLTVAENISFGLDSLPIAERAARVQRQIAQAHLAGFENRSPRELSGGEQQRVALARALAIEPRALLLDEPLSALDTHLRGQIESQLIDTLSNFRRPALFVTHNMEEAYRIATNLVVLTHGRVAAHGPKEEIFGHPPNLEVALLTGLKNFSRAKQISTDAVEALDWNCTLQTLRGPQPIAGPPKYVGIRAHYVDFLEASSCVSSGANVFPCWLVRASETPFRITLYLRLHNPPDGSGEHHLQAELFKEKWLRMKQHPQPWHVQLSPESLMVLPE
ncbi:MAG TPA: sulfate/molybdate ABC transporter ATP-binding protein [Candidatus Acidoferrales bacterium]|nr:sulfate/molybdate ABC transporter ATP-binding protein [Candidatus Acidoferrales bacterium]